MTKGETKTLNKVRGELKKLITRPCFSCGTEAAWWTERNCDRCYKSARKKANAKSGNEYTISRCRIFDEIGEQWMGYGNEPVSLRTYDITRLADCPYRQENWPKRNKVKNDKSLTLIFEEAT